MKEEIEALKKEVAKLKRLAYRDHLTGLLNRRGFEDSIRPLIVQYNSSNNKNLAPRRGFIIKSISLVLIDIDNFKDLNDKYGHPEGDLVLQHLAKEITKNFRKSDLVGRWGGEEMIVAMIGASTDSAVENTEKLQQIITRSGFKPRYAFSAGVAEMSSTVDSFKKLYEMTDNALYRAKNTGRNKVVNSKM